MDSSDTREENNTTSIDGHVAMIHPFLFDFLHFIGSQPPYTFVQEERRESSHSKLYETIGFAESIRFVGDKKRKYEELFEIEDKECEDATCPTCHEESKYGVVNECGHFVCVECFPAMVKNSINNKRELNCPLCRDDWISYEDPSRKKISNIIYKYK